MNSPQHFGIHIGWQFLRDQLGFRGLIFSDDLSMAGAKVAGGPLDRAKAAMNAGCNASIYNDTPALDEVIDGLSSDSLLLPGERLNPDYENSDF